MANVKDWGVIWSSHCFQKTSPDWNTIQTVRRGSVIRHHVTSLSAHLNVFVLMFMWWRDSGERGERGERGDMFTIRNRILTSWTSDCCSFFSPPRPEWTERRGWCWRVWVSLSCWSRTRPSWLGRKIVWGARCPSGGDWPDLSTEILQFSVNTICVRVLLGPTITDLCLHSDYFGHKIV